MSSAPETDDVLERLAAVDRRIKAQPFGAASLAPDRDRATSLADLVVTHAVGDEVPIMATALLEVAQTQLSSFPGNIFWDFDFFVATLCQRGRSARDFATSVNALSDLVIALLKLYGKQSTIQFQYVHDFSYGFDWARWVRRHPTTRRNTGPLDPAFLTYSKNRAYELLAMIAKNDERYPTLPQGSWRNPFRFSRSPEDEKRLYSDLAADGLVPLWAWKASVKPRWEDEFDRIREDRAMELGLFTELPTADPMSAIESD